MANRLDEGIVSAAFPLRRFVLFLLASAILHAILLVALRSSPAKRVSLAPRLEIRLVAPVERKSTAPAHLPSEQKVFTASRASRTQASRAGTLPHVSPAESTGAGDIQSPTLPKISLGALLDSARRIIRDDERRHPPPAKMIDNDRPVLPQLARALQREPPGETRFASGMIKVVTASGSVYCLRPMPEFARGGPVEPTSIPTNCP